MKFLSDILAKAGLTVDGVVTLNNTATGQTPDANDNSTKLATTAWVRTFVQPYSLPIASASVLGGIKVGSGLSINSGTGVLSVVGASAASIKSTQTFVVTEGQTVFTVTGGYTPGLIDIFLNGVYLSPNQTVATNGTTFTINDPAAAGDIVDVIVASPIFEGAASTTDQLPEGSINLYYTNARARAAITLTTTGVSGAATYNSSTGVFNIPNYQGLVPAGGVAGDILAKVSGTNYDVTWIPNYTSTVQHTVKAAVAVTKGQAVYVSSADGTNMIVSKASNASEGTSSKTLGLVAQSMAINDQGFVVTEGLLAGLDTSTAQAGDPVWLGTNGNLIFGLLNKPTAPAHLVFIGIVTRVQQNNGEIFVKVQNGFELDELHNLSVASPSDGDMIKYVASTGLWTKIAATTTNITEGTNLYYTQARFDTAFAAKSTTNLTEGTNLYYTTARVNSDFDARLATKSTTNLAEGTNLYYTDARVGTYLTANSYATQSYVSTQINNLVSGAPGLLDTLDELAAALGDDPNFATTISTALSNRLRIDIGTQGLTSTQQGYGRTNLGLGSLAVLSSVANAQITDVAWSKVTGAPAFITSYTETDTLSSVTARGSSTSTTLNLDGRVNIGNGLTRPSALNSDSVAHARIGGADVHLYVASLGAGGGYKVAVQAARTSDFASFSLDLQSNGGTLLYGGNEVATRTWVTSQSYLTSYTETDTLASVTGRGATTSSNLTFSGQLTLNKNGTQLKISRADTAAADWFFHSWASGINIYPNAAGTVYFGRDGSATNVDVYNGTLYQQGNAVWHAGNFTPSNYLPLSGGTMTGQLYAPSIGTGVYEGAIQIRETAYVGSGQSTWGYAPAITFHWGNRTVKKFGIRADGLFAVDDEPLALRSWVTSQSYLTSITSSNVTTALGYTPATDSHNHDLIRYSLRAPNNIDSMSSSDFRSYVFGSSANGHTISTARWNSVPSGLSGMNMYGTLFAWAGSDTHGFIATDYSVGNIQVGGGNGNSINWRVTLIHSSNIGSQSVSYASSAGTANSVSWNNVSGRPSALSQFSNDSGYITSSGSISGSAAQFAGRGVSEFEGNFGTTINAAGLDSNTYYPVTVGLGTNRLYKLSVRVSLNSNAPSWSTHPSGFSVKLIWYANGNGWGTNDTSRYIECYNYRFVSGKAPIGGIQQLSNSSEEVVWIRGGGVYYFYASEPVTWSLKTSSYDNYPPPYTQNVTPTTADSINDVWLQSSGRVSYGEVYSPGALISNYRLQLPNMTIGYWDGANNRIEGGTDRPLLITSYNTIKVGISGGTNWQMLSSGQTVQGGGGSRTTYGHTIAMTNSSAIYSANADLGDGSRFLSIVNESTTTGALSALSFRINPASGGSSGNAMMDMKFVNNGSSTSSIHYTFLDGGNWRDRLTLKSTGQLIVKHASTADSGYDNPFWIWVAADADAIVIQNTTSGGTPPKIYFRDTNGIIQTGNSEIRLRTSNSNSLSAYLNGSTWNVTGDVVAYASDRRLKENIKTIPDAIEKINSLSGVTFDWNQTSEKAGFVPKRKHNEIGVLAQEVQAVIPQAIEFAPFDRGIDGSSLSGENYLTVKYEKIVPLLIQGIKEQQAQIESQKSEIEELKDLVKQLINR